MIEIDFSQLPAEFIYRKIIKEVDTQLIEHLMKERGMTQEEASEAMGVARSTLQKKISQYGIK